MRRPVNVKSAESVRTVAAEVERGGMTVIVHVVFFIRSVQVVQSRDFVLARTQIDVIVTPPVRNEDNRVRTNRGDGYFVRIGLDVSHSAKTTRRIGTLLIFFALCIEEDSVPWPVMTVEVEVVLIIANE